MKRSLILLVSLSYCFMSYALGTSAQARKPPHYEALVFQKAHSPGFCMGIAGGSTKPGANVRQGDCEVPGRQNAPKDQIWLLEKTGNKTGNAIYYHIRNLKNRRMCLGVEHGSHALRANIRQGYCNDNRDQMWSLPNIPGDNDPAVVHIKNANGFCIGAEGGSTTHAQLKQNTCTLAKDQAWVKLGIVVRGL
jgi:hypothetical protein